MEKSTQNNNNDFNWFNEKLDTNKKSAFEKENKAFSDLVNESKNISVPENKSKDEIWNELNAKIKDRKQKTIVRRIKASISIAASIALILSFYFAFRTTETEIYVENGKQQTIFLPDSSKITINSASKIVYNESNWENERKLTLEGEAFFEVKKGSKFTVETDLGAVEVLGTSFNIYKRENEFDIVCFTGKVKVSNKQNEFKIITKGKAVKFLNNNKLEKYSCEIKTKAQWKKGSFYFDAAPLKEVFSELQRQYNIQIELPNIKNRVYTGYFDNKDLEKALINVCIPMNLNFEKKKNQYIITNN